MTVSVKSAKQPAQQPAKQPAQQTAKQPAQQPAQQTAKQPAKQPAQQTTKQTTKQPAQQTAQQTAKQPAPKKTLKKVSVKSVASPMLTSDASVSTETFKKEMKIDKSWNNVPLKIEGDDNEQIITIDTSYTGMFDSSGNLKLKATNNISVFDVAASIVSVKGNTLKVANSELAQYFGDKTGTVTLRKDPRYWKVVRADGITGGENARGRYSGASPYQAANKALTEIYRRGTEDDFKPVLGSRVGVLEYLAEKHTIQDGGATSGKQENIEKEKEILHKGLIEKITKANVDIRLDNGELLTCDEKNVYKIIKFSMKESTRGSTKRIHRYEGCRVKLKTPIEYDINKKSDSDSTMVGGDLSSATDSPKMIKYYKNKLEKLTKEKLQPNSEDVTTSEDEAKVETKVEAKVEAKAKAKANDKAKAKVETKAKVEAKATAKVEAGDTDAKISKKASKKASPKKQAASPATM
jgi:hypothetical protein